MNYNLNCIDTQYKEIQLFIIIKKKYCNVKKQSINKTFNKEILLLFLFLLFFSMISQYGYNMVKHMIINSVFII